MSMREVLLRIEAFRERYRPQDWALVDCRYRLDEPGAGRRAYREAHIPGAVFADTGQDLSGEPLSDHGRHPLPSADRLVGLFSSLGIDSNTQVLAYDDSSGAFAARLWWLLRYMGHEAVAVLDGGWQAWLATGLETRAGEEKRQATRFEGQARRDRLLLIDEVSSAPLLVDSREAARYRGETEPIDPVAGHIPGAVNRCWKQNICDDGYFRDVQELRDEFAALLAGADAAETGFYCGSGVSACHNLLAMAHAGLPEARLYAGSWSEWCTSPGREIVRGPGP